MPEDGQYVVAQITDLHIGIGDDIGAEGNYHRLRAVFERLRAFRRQPDLVIATGDLTETGSVEAYRLLRRMLRESGYEVRLCLGNHDVAGNFRRVFGDEGFDGADMRYVLDLGPLVLVVLDTHDERLHGGVLGEERAAWLDAALAAHRGRPVLIAQHHPPIENGIAWMSEKAGAEWIAREAMVLSRHDHVVGVITGHVHRNAVQAFAGTQVTICGATAAALALELDGISARVADERPLIVDEPPCLALHRWDGRNLVTHYAVAGGFDTLLTYHDGMKPAMREVFHVED